MAKSVDVAESATSLITDDQLERVREFAREPILLDDETIDDIAPGTARHRAVEAALAELDAGRETPSPEWRRRYSLLLGLERLLTAEPVLLADGAELTEHQIDVLSGTLAALTAELEDSVAAESWNGAGRSPAELDGDEPGSPVDAELEGDGGNGAIEEVAEEDEALAPDEEEPLDWEEPAADLVAEAPEDPGASRRFWFEHATGSGKTVAALGFVEGSRTGGVLILTHRRNLVDQFIGEISDRGYKDRLSPPLMDGSDHPYGPVTVETYQWFVRNAERISDAYAIVICDEAHTALGEKTSACIRRWPEPVFIGMTATGALIARHVADLFPTQTSRFDLAQAARRGVIAPLRNIRIPPGPGVRTIAKVPLRRGEVDQDFDQEELAKLLDQEPFNVAVADLYRSRFRKVPGVVYTAGVRHANNVAASFRAARDQRPGRLRRDPEARAGGDPRRIRARRGGRAVQRDAARRGLELTAGDDLHAPRPTASRRVYQQRVGRVTRRAPEKEAGLVIDFVHPATTHDETIVTLHSLLDRDVYRGGAIVVGPVRRGRGRRVRVERRVVPVSADPERRLAVLERELWRIAVENLNYSEQHAWAALAGARVTNNNWRRAKAMLQHDQAKELRRRFLLTCVQRNRNHQLRLKALGEIAALRDPTPSTTPSRWWLPGRATSAAPAPRCCSRRSSSGGSAAAIRRRLGSGGWPRSPASCTRNTPCSAGPRPSGCWDCSSTRRGEPTAETRGASSTPPASRIAAWRSRCWPRRSRTPRRPRRCCAAPACGWPASPRPSPASCFATSRKSGGRRRRRRGKNGRPSGKRWAETAAEPGRTAPRRDRGAAGAPR